MVHRGNFNIKVRHLIVVGVLVIAFSTAFIMRSYPIKYGFFLNEFDPYFDYRATKYIVDHGLNAYLKWHDTMSWYPEGRNVPKTSQSGLHIVSAYLYEAFGKGSSLLDFTIMLPVILGSLTTIVIFAMVRVIGGTTAGMFSALLFAFSPAIISRGNLGWFKSEPLGLFFGLLAMYLFISAIQNKNAKYAIAKAVLGGLMLGLGNASWGGVQYFSIPVSLFLIALPFFRKDTNIPMYVAIAFTVFSVASAGAFPRPGISYVLGLPGIALMGGTIFFVAAHITKKISKPQMQTRNMIFLLIGFIIVSIAVIAGGAYHPASFRYLNAINPFLSSQNPLTQSVAEHATPTVVDYFTNYSILIMFAGMGAWMAFKRRSDTSIFALILGLTGLYVSATFARLLVFASIGIIILAGLGLFEITHNFISKDRSSSIGVSKKLKSKKKPEQMTDRSQRSRIVLMTYAIIIIFLLCLPMIYPPHSNWLTLADIPPSITNGGTAFKPTNDWTDALNWISKNTPKGSVIASWWDYGYWITTLGNRTSLADNATINQTRIAAIAKMFMDQRENGVKIAHDLRSDYLLIYIVGQRLPGPNGTSFYALGGGGDESKKIWFIRIGGFDETKYIQPDNQGTPTPTFWNSTLLGKLIPFTPVFYSSIQNNREFIQPNYTQGSVAIYKKDIKYPPKETTDQPFTFVYASPSFNSDKPGPFFAVLIYKVNPNYIPKVTSDPYNEESGAIPVSNPMMSIPKKQTSSIVAKK